MYLDGELLDRSELGHNGSVYCYSKALRQMMVQFVENQARTPDFAGG